jgi:hypothetical protein
MATRRWLRITSRILGVLCVLGGFAMVLSPAIRSFSGLPIAAGLLILILTFWDSLPGRPSRDHDTE